MQGKSNSIFNIGMGALLIMIIVSLSFTYTSNSDLAKLKAENESLKNELKLMAKTQEASIKKFGDQKAFMDFLKNDKQVNGFNSIKLNKSVLEKLLLAFNQSKESMIRVSIVNLRSNQLGLSFNNSILFGFATASVSSPIMCPSQCRDTSAQNVGIILNSPKISNHIPF